MGMMLKNLAIPIYKVLPYFVIFFSHKKLTATIRDT